jgi:nucleoside-diphosphate-sugar epimerase
MQILVTSAASRLSQTVADSLSGTHTVRLTDRKQVQSAFPFVKADLGHDESTDSLVRGVDVIIHSPEPDPADDVSTQLDVAMRGTYNLLWAAWEAGVKRVVLLSTLDVMTRYAEDLAVTERWSPSPTTEPRVLCQHMAEFVAREFAREQKLTVMCLRLGNVAFEGAASSTSALYPDDLAQAVERALTVDVVRNWTSVPNQWNLFHVQSSVPNQRFLTETAQSQLGFQPADRG